MNILLKIRKENNMNQTELSNRLGIAVSTYSLYESNKSLIPKNIAHEISCIFGIKVEEIFLPVKFKILE